MDTSRHLVSVRSYALAFAVALSPVVFQTAYSCERGDTFLLSLELEVSGQDQIVNFSTTNRSYAVTTSSSTAILRVVTKDPDSIASYRWFAGGTAIGPYVDIGVGGGEVTVTVSDGQTALYVGVRAPEGAFDNYIVDVDHVSPVLHSCDEAGIRDAIAAGGGPHYFDCAGPTTVLTASSIDIDNDVILDGEGNLIVDGQNQHRVFRVPSGFTVELRGITISGGYWDDNGAGIANWGALSLTDVVITRCASTDFGGALYHFGPSLDLNRVTVTMNTAPGGGAIYLAGTGPLTVVDSTMSNNTANSFGGAVYSNGTASFERTTFSGNSAAFGGAIIAGTLGPMMLDDCVVSNNSSYTGGGIEVRGDFTMNGSAVTDNVATNRGGGIYVSGAATLTNSTVSGNDATYGGGIAVLGAGSLKATNSTISGNSASSQGGAIHGKDSSMVTLAHVTVVGNTAVEGSAGYGTDTLTATYRNNVIEGTCFAGSTTGTIISHGYNIESPGDTCFLTHPTDSPGVAAVGLGPLQDNGGTTSTRAPVDGTSFAIDLVPAAACLDADGSPLTTDQRGVARPEGTNCDSGAVEGYCPECDDSLLCTIDRCDPVTRTCSYPSVVCQSDGQCMAGACDPASGSCHVTDGTSCDSGNGQCLAGACDWCANVTCPDDGNDCTQDACNQANGACYTPVRDGNSCDAGSGLCIDGICDLCYFVTCSDDGNECTEDVCDPGTGLCSPPVPDGTPCDSGNGQCVAGACVLDPCSAMVCEAGNPACPCGWEYRGESYWYAGRYGHAMAYAGPNECVMFAGHSGGNLQDVWWYNVASNSWSPGSPSTAPPHRYNHDMAYASGEKVLMFGGTNTQGPTYGDTWIFDLVSGNWGEQAPTTSPSARHGHQMVYLGDDKVLLFGGRSGTTNSAETWVYDLSDGNWTLKSPTTSPSARYNHAMSRIGGDKALLFGGFANSVFAALGDTWVYDLSDDTWTQMSPAASPMVRYAHATAWLGDDQVVLFGGHGPGAGQYGSPLDDTWIYDLSDDTWTESTDAPQPDARLYHASCETSLDASSDVVIFGGQLNWLGTDLSAETWSFGAP